MHSKVAILGYFLAGLLVTQFVFAGGHNQARKPAIAKDQALTAEIDAVLNEYEVLWDKQDPAGLAALWDQNDPEPFYLAEEQDEWRIGWEQVNDYFDPPGDSTVTSIRMRFDGVQARWLADDLAFAKFWIRFDTKMDFLPNAIGTDARASAIFRKTDAGWRLITWAESPGSPILYVQRLYKQHREEGEQSPMPYISKLYERHTREDFPEYMETHKKEE
ncbi:MAG: nuclear transport factor 2 family protein [Gammaproteobacteria bacterium]|nr:nuclear transport factor 2 family protein [Gammaproteobacteria bacterium]MCP4088357.1 nuclear transport factor 2 family protein [Gammaproteobacteria bacterium]MCP4275105.1 nuclear transport factor 2 family protein [Gammaproteobacteria bacterium]MCP4830979.1 nuclear transport factor 2 family protein [Gammaproteobacteria bacterium]MCP4927500.1 nuclear transport factor 2 family protein [Gammaproteobacteria bacterium]